jgi:hypothetical protein
MIRLSALLGLLAAVAPLAMPLGHAQNDYGFGAFAAGAAGASYTVTYRVTGTAGGQALDGTQTWYMRPPESRYDMSVGPRDTSTYMLSSGSYMCRRVGSVYCLKMADGQLGLQNRVADVQGQVQGSPSNYSVTPTDARVIAGQEAQCFIVSSASSSFNDATFCYGAGIPLYMAIHGDKVDVAQEATSYSTAVSASDLQLPATPLVLPSIPGLSPGGAPNLPGRGEGAGQ